MPTRPPTTYTCMHSTGSATPCRRCPHSSMVHTNQGRFVTQYQRPFRHMTIEEPPESRPARRSIVSTVYEFICCPCISIVEYFETRESLKLPGIILLSAASMATLFFILFTGASLLGLTFYNGTTPNDEAARPFPKKGGQNNS